MMRFICCETINFYRKYKFIFAINSAKVLIYFKFCNPGLIILLNGV